MLREEDVKALNDDRVLSSVFANCDFLFNEIMARFETMNNYDKDAPISVPLRIFEKDEILRDQVIRLIDTYIDDGIARKELDSLDKNKEEYEQKVAALSLLDSYYEMLNKPTN